eukprot:1162726-Prorocentrum_minimum.AAC.1
MLKWALALPPAEPPAVHVADTHVRAVLQHEALEHLPRVRVRLPLRLLAVRQAHLHAATGLLTVTESGRMWPRVVECGREWSNVASSGRM